MKKEKEYYFIAGLPRSGSTLLCNILSQNPRFYATSTSGVLALLMQVRNNWNKMAAFKATPNDAAQFRVIRGILENFYADKDQHVIFDKCRGWTSAIEMLEHVLGRKVKILAPVRDMRDILASFEKLWRNTSKMKQLSQESQNPQKFQTIQGRMDVWMHPGQPVGSAYNSLVDAIQRGYGDRIFLIDYDDLTSKPAQTMKKVYAFLDEEYFEHDFDNVEQVTQEDDRVHGIDNLHTIRKKVEPMEPQWPKILGPMGEQFAKLNFWKEPKLTVELIPNSTPKS